MLRCSNALGDGWGGGGLLPPGGAGADPVAAGALAAEEALRQAGIAAGKDAHEVDVEGADGAVLLGDPWEGAGELVDVVLAVAGLAYVDNAALLLLDAGRLVHPLRERPALDPLGVGGGHALRHLVEEVVQTLVPLAVADLLQEDGGQCVVGLGEEGVRLFGER